jgi:hypothetical protein
MPFVANSIYSLIPANMGMAKPLKLVGVPNSIPSDHDVEVASIHPKSHALAATPSELRTRKCGPDWNDEWRWNK